MTKDGENGFLVPPADSVARAQGVITWLKNLEKAKEMGIKGQKICKGKFDVNIIAERLEVAYMFALDRVREGEN